MVILKNIFKARNFELELGKKTYIMGILNITPDSFSDGGKYFSKDDAINHVYEMINAGADIIDIGAQSTRPNYNLISEAEEWARLEDVLKCIFEKGIDIPVSIDTFYPYVAESALELGVSIINDITGCKNIRMLEIAAAYDAGIIIMHPGDAAKSNGEYEYQLGVTGNVKEFFDIEISKALEAGMDINHICLDPGIGFGKTEKENFELLKNTNVLKRDNIAYLVGASRKRITADPDVPFDKRIAGTIAVHTIAQLGGADILRAHDVFEAVQAAKLIDKILGRV